MKLQLITHSEALAALADGAVVYVIRQSSLRPASRTKARDLCSNVSGSSDSPFMANEEGDLIYLGYDRETNSRNFEAYRRLCAEAES